MNQPVKLDRKFRAAQAHSAGFLKFLLHWFFIKKSNSPPTLLRQNFATPKIAKYLRFFSFQHVKKYSTVVSSSLNFRRVVDPHGSRNQGAEAPICFRRDKNPCTIGCYFTWTITEHVKNSDLVENMKKTRNLQRNYKYYIVFLSRHFMEFIHTSFGASETTQTKTRSRFSHGRLCESQIILINMSFLGHKFVMIGIHSWF